MVFDGPFSCKAAISLKCPKNVRGLYELPRMPLVGIVGKTTATHSGYVTFRAFLSFPQGLEISIDSSAAMAPKKPTQKKITKEEGSKPLPGFGFYSQNGWPGQPKKGSTMHIFACSGNVRT